MVALEVIETGPGDTVLVSAAAGWVGSGARWRRRRCA